MNGYAERYFKEVAEGLLGTIATGSDNKTLGLDEALDIWVEKTKEKRDVKGVFFFAGNGASASMAEHCSADCFKNADMLTCTCSETAHITAISNDLSYEDVFSYRIGKTFSDNDMLIAISSSGNSPNMVKAVKTAKELDGFVVTITGISAENKMRAMGDLNFFVPLDTYGTVESAHAALLHCWLDMFLDKYMGGRH